MSKKIRTIFINSKKNYKELKNLKNVFKVVKNINDADICISVGGDGTFIDSAKIFNGPILPISSNEKGSASYYCDVGLSDIERIIEDLSEGKYYTQTLSRKIKISYKGKDYYAVNEALLRNFSGNVYFEIYAKLTKNDKKEKLYPFIMGGDGALITSVIGSTAYNMSANGPIIVNDGSLCITFLNVNGPFKNPIVISSDAVVYIKVVKYKGLLKFDDDEISLLKPKDEFKVSLSDQCLKVIKFQDMREPFADKLEKIISSKMIKSQDK